MPKTCVKAIIDTINVTPPGMYTPEQLSLSINGRYVFDDDSVELFGHAMNVALSSTSAEINAVAVDLVAAAPPGAVSPSKILVRPWHDGGEYTN